MGPSLPDRLARELRAPERLPSRAYSDASRFDRYFYNKESLRRSEKSDFLCLRGVTISYGKAGLLERDEPFESARRATDVTGSLCVRIFVL